MPGFHNVLFPTEISYGATGGPKFNTLVIPTPTGTEQRIPIWEQSLLEWNVALPIWDEARLNRVLSFFYARQGRAYGFLFKDWTDYFAGMTYDTDNSLVYDDPVEVATGDGATTEFQLVKLYTSGSVTHVRKITRLANASFEGGSPNPYYQILLDSGSGPVVQTTGFTVNESTGKVAFTTPPAVGVKVLWRGRFYVAVRFDTDAVSVSMEAIHSGAWSSIALVGLRE